MSTTLGITFACRTDLTPRFDVCTSDRQILGDDIFRRMMNDSVIGDSPEAIDYGDNVRKLLGAALSDGEVDALGLRYSVVLQRSPRILTADVVVTRMAAAPGQIALRFSVSVTTEVGPFSFLFALTSETFSEIGVTAGSP